MSLSVVVPMLNEAAALPALLSHLRHLQANGAEVVLVDGGSHDDSTSLARAAGSLPVFSAGSHYAIHILSSDQRGLAERFATRDIDRFAGLDWHEGAGGIPLIDGAAAVLECHNRSRYEEGDHVIFVGEVERCAHRAGAQPLIFHGGRYFTELPL